MNDWFNRGVVGRDSLVQLTVDISDKLVVSSSRAFSR